MRGCQAVGEGRRHGGWHGVGAAGLLFLIAVAVGCSGDSGPLVAPQPDRDTRIQEEPEGFVEEGRKEGADGSREEAETETAGEAAEGEAGAEREEGDAGQDEPAEGGEREAGGETSGEESEPGDSEDREDPAETGREESGDERDETTGEGDGSGPPVAPPSPPPSGSGTSGPGWSPSNAPIYDEDYTRFTTWSQFMSAAPFANMQQLDNWGRHQINV
ncbi:MAG: hypothetical protein R3195_01450, partial [Gemmatimonadota bacterium]|nr:hypothetical protein [Gemmatimonadota bacterium]